MTKVTGKDKNSDPTVQKPTINWHQNFVTDTFCLVVSFFNKIIIRHRFPRYLTKVTLSPLVPSVPKMGHNKKFDVKITPFNIRMKNISFQSPEVLSNRTNHVLTWKWNSGINWLKSSNTEPKAQNRNELQQTSCEQTNIQKLSCCRENARLYTNAQTIGKLSQYKYVHTTPTHFRLKFHVFTCTDPGLF